MPIREADNQAVATDLLWKGFSDGARNAFSAVGIHAESFEPGVGPLETYLSEQNVGSLLIIEHRNTSYGRLVIAIDQIPNGEVFPRYFGVRSGDSKYLVLPDYISDSPSDWNVLAHSNQSCDIGELQKARLEFEAPDAFIDAIGLLNKSVVSNTLFPDVDIRRLYSLSTVFDVPSLLEPRNSGFVVLTASVVDEKVQMALGIAEDGDIWMFDEENRKDFPERDGSYIGQRRVRAASLTQRKFTWEQTMIVVGALGQEDGGQARNRVHYEVLRHNLRRYADHYAQKDPELQHIRNREYRIDWEHAIHADEADGKVAKMYKKLSAAADHIGSLTEEKLHKASTIHDEFSAFNNTRYLCLRVDPTGVIWAHKVGPLSKTDQYLSITKGFRWGGIERIPRVYFPLIDQTPNLSS